jgi:NADPH:quinone reductase-like Zn-dependent oxidoreductase
VRALRYERYGPPDVLHVTDIAEPSPRAGEVKVRVHAVSLNPLDWKNRAGHMRWVPGFSLPPRTLGSDFAGEIVGVGGGAISHYVGERVFGSLLPFGRDGALAEYVVAGADGWRRCRMTSASIRPPHCRSRPERRCRRSWTKHGSAQASAS